MEPQWSRAKLRCNQGWSEVSYHHTKFKCKVRWNFWIWKILFLFHFSSVLALANLENLHIPLMSSTRIPFSNTRLKFSLKIWSVRTDFNEEGANSTLSVAHINKSDSGNYTCSVGQILSFTTSVHVLNGRNMLWIFRTLLTQLWTEGEWF